MAFASAKKAMKNFRPTDRQLANMAVPYKKHELYRTWTRKTYRGTTFTKLVIVWTNDEKETKTK